MVCRFDSYVLFDMLPLGLGRLVFVGCLCSLCYLCFVCDDFLFCLFGICFDV